MAHREGPPPKLASPAVSLRWPRGKRRILEADSRAEAGRAGLLCPHTPDAGDAGAGALLGVSGMSRCQCFHGKHLA